MTSNNAGPLLLKHTIIWKRPHQRSLIPATAHILHLKLFDSGFLSVFLSIASLLHVDNLFLVLNLHLTITLFLHPSCFFYLFLFLYVDFFIHLFPFWLHFYVHLSYYCLKCLSFVFPLSPSICFSLLSITFLSLLRHLMSSLRFISMT